MQPVLLGIALYLVVQFAIGIALSRKIAGESDYARLADAVCGGAGGGPRRVSRHRERPPYHAGLRAGVVSDFAVTFH